MCCGEASTGPDRLIAFVELQMRFDGTDHKALPIGQRRKLQRGLRFGQRLELCDILRIGISAPASIGRERQSRLARSARGQIAAIQFVATKLLAQFA